MAITPSFQVAQSGLTPNIVEITDDSTGADAAIASRRVYVQTATGEYLTPVGTTTDYTTWSYSDASISLDILAVDVAVNILVQWLDSGNAVLHELDNNYGLSQYGKQFFYYLIQTLGFTPSTYQDTNYSGNLVIFYGNLRAGDNAVTFGNDIAAAQNCYNRETQMQQNESKYF